jgi:hypothetical protein
MLGDAMSIFSAQHVRAVRELARAHPAEQVEVLGDAAVAVRAVLARLGQRAAVARASPRRSDRVDVGVAVLDQVPRRSGRASRSSREA